MHKTVHVPAPIRAVPRDQTYDFGEYSPLAWSVATELESAAGEQQQSYAASFPPLPRRARARRTATIGSSTGWSTHTFDEVMAWAAASAPDLSRAMGCAWSE